MVDLAKITDFWHNKKSEVTIFVLVLIFVFTLVYAPHFQYDYPLHIDEWHHITQAEKLSEGGYENRFAMLEAGFHLFLLGISSIFDLVLVYKFLPAIFGVLSAIILFFFIYDLTGEYWMGIFAMIFFAMLKSNVNTGGLWFFTPLTFSIPLIYAFFWLFVTGVERTNNKRILISYFIYIIILFSHPISATFMLPILAIFSLIKHKQVLRMWKIFVPALLIPVMGMVFLYAATLQKDILGLLARLIFERGWGVYELNLSPLLGYSIVGLILALVGCIYAIKKRYHVFLIWPAFTLLTLIYYPFTDFTVLAPYQRFFYYFIISLPALSAFGLYYLYQFFSSMAPRKIKDTVFSVIVFALLLFSMVSVYSIPQNIQLYKLIDEDDFKTLQELDKLDKGKTVISGPDLGTAIYPVTKNSAVGTIFFYGSREDADMFVNTTCKIREELIDKHHAKYAISRDKLLCNWTVIYNRTGYIYEVR